MMDDLPPRQLAIISEMMHAKKNLPDEFWAVGIMQEIAGVVMRNQTALGDDDYRFMIGVGAYIAAIAEKELSAEVQMTIALHKAARHG